ncbi:MAG: 3-deoxy-manno-octulosonate cytidylyltransferase [Verrucomicrobia bacterium]|nr:3-deoxy-manno-octulosonate cytidylyltransferase [Verrucomicrobiota bacterium]
MKQGAIGFIPARWGSSRFPGKPLAKIFDKTLIQSTYEAAKTADLEAVVVATDDLRIFEHVRSFGGEVVMTSSNCATGTDRLAEAVLSHPLGQQASIIVNIQGDWPCVCPKGVDAVVQALQEDEGAVMSSGATLLDPKDLNNPHTVKCWIDDKGRATAFSRLPLADGPYKHLGIYCYRRSFLLTYPTLPTTPGQEREDLEQLKALEHGYHIAMAIVGEAGPSVDRPEDIQKVERYKCRQNIYS